MLPETARKNNLNDSAHGASMAKSDSRLEEGTIIGKHGSQAPLVQIEHNGEDLAAFVRALEVSA
jgi:hypothetical protein